MKTWKNIGDAAIMFGIQTLNYGMMVVNYRAVAQANYFWSALSDFLLATFSFFVIVNSYIQIICSRSVSALRSTCRSLW